MLPDFCSYSRSAASARSPHSNGLSFPLVPGALVARRHGCVLVDRRQSGRLAMGLMAQKHSYAARRIIVILGVNSWRGGARLPFRGGLESRSPFDWGLHTQRTPDLSDYCQRHRRFGRTDAGQHVVKTNGYCARLVVAHSLIS